MSFVARNRGLFRAGSGLWLPSTGYPVLFSDDFNRGSLGSSWQILVGTPSILGNKWRGGDPATGSHAKLVVTPEIRLDNSVEGTVHSTWSGSGAGGYIRLCTRLVDASNFYSAEYDGATTSIMIRRRLGGTYTTLSSVNVGAVTPPFGLKLQIVDSDLTSFLNTGNGYSTVATVTDTLLPVGGVGILGHTPSSGDALVDDFIVRDLHTLYPWTMPTCTTVFSDDFNRANGALGANYIGGTSPDFEIVSNQVQGGGPFEKQLFYVNDIAVNHFAQIKTVARITNRSGPAPSVRDGWYNGWHDGGQWRIGETFSFAIIGSRQESLQTLPWTSRMIAVSDNLQLWAFQQDEWRRKIQVTDNSQITQQKAGVRYDRVSGTAVFDDLVVGTASIP